MSSKNDEKHPVGSVQAICAGSAGLFTVLVAFIGYTAFNAKGQEVPWTAISFIYLLPALVAAVALALVPWLVTKPCAESENESSIKNARSSFLLGAVCSIFSMSAFIAIDYMGQ